MTTKTAPTPIGNMGKYRCHVCRKAVASFERGGEKVLVNHSNDFTPCAGSEAKAPVHAGFEKLVKSLAAQF